MAKEFYRKGIDIYDASTNQRITSPDWEANWTGRATEIDTPTSGESAFQEATGGPPTSQDDQKAIETFDQLSMPETALDSQVDQARSAYQQASRPNTFLAYLKSALGQKLKPGEEKLGMSGLLDKAGLPTTGAAAFPILSQGITMRQNELIKSGADLAKVLETSKGIVQDQALILKDNLDALTTKQNFLIEQQFGLEKEKRQYDEKVKLLRMQTDLEKEMIAYNENFKDEDFQFISGNDNQPSGIFDKNTGTFQSLDDLNAQGVITDASGSSYDITTYATDFNHEASIKRKIKEIGKMESTEQMDSYIQQVAPGSPVTGQMVVNASEKYGVSWEAMMAIIDHESLFGTSNVAKNNNNVGGMTWTGSNGQKGTARPAKEGGYYIKYNTFQEGVDAVAKNLAGRKVDTPTPKVDKWDASRQFISDNPEATNNELKSALLEHSGLNVTEVDSLLVDRDEPSGTPEDFQASLKESFQQLEDSGYSRDEAKEYIIDAYTDGGKKELPQFQKDLIEDSLVDIYGKTFWQKVLPGGR